MTENIERDEVNSIEQTKDNFLTRASPVNTNFEPKPGTPEWDRVHWKRSEDFDEVLARDMEGNEEVELSFEDRIKEDLFIQFSDDCRLTQELADSMGINFKNPLEDNPNVRIMPFGKPQLFGCYLPENHFVSQKGIWKITQRYDKQRDEIIPAPELICTTRAIPTGYYECDGDSDIMEITYFTETSVEVMHVPFAAILGSKEWKELVRKNNIGRLYIIDDELGPMIKFFKGVKQANEGVHRGEDGSLFKAGKAYTTCGWKDKDFTKFVSGNRLYTETYVNNKYVFEQTECIFLDIEHNTHADQKLACKGTLEGWIESVRDILKHPRLRFACYKQLDIMLAKMLNSIPCTLAIVFKTSNGKTVTLMCTSSMVGNPNDNGEGLLLPGDISKPAINANLGVYKDHTLLIDDLTNIKEDLKKGIAYIPANRQESMRSKNDGRLREHKQFMSNVIATSEFPIISDRAADGADSRIIDAQKAPIPQITDKTIRDAKSGILKNYGHILGLFLNKISEHRAELPIWYEEAISRLQTDISSTKVKRQADYYALAEVAGRLLEEIFQEIGIEPMNPSCVVDLMWKECMIDRNYKPQYVKLVESMWDFYIQNSNKHFVKGDNEPTEGMGDVYGWDLPDYIDFIPKTLKAELKRDDFVEINALLTECKSYGIIDSNGDALVKSTHHIKEIGGKKTSMTVYRLMKSKVYENTSIEDPKKLAEEEKKYIAEQREIQIRMNKEIKAAAAAAHHEW
jgi:hypothetical protein